MVEANASDVAKEPGLWQALQDAAAHSVLAADEEKSGPLLKQLPPELGDTQFLEVVRWQQGSCDPNMFLLGFTLAPQPPDFHPWPSSSLTNTD